MSSSRFHRFGSVGAPLLALLLLLFLVAGTIQAAAKPAQAGSAEAAATSTDPPFHAFGYIPFHRPGFPYHYYYHHGITHLVFQGIFVDDHTLTLRGLHEQDRHVPGPDEWKRVRSDAYHHGAKLLLSIGGSEDKKVKGLSIVFRTYFMLQPSEAEMREKRRRVISEMAKFLVERELDGINVDWEPAHAQETNMWLGMSYFLRDLHTEVGKLRAAPLFTSIVMDPHPRNAGMVFIAKLAENVNVVQWSTTNDKVDHAFFSLPQDEKERNRIALGHGVQPNAYLYHSSLNFTMSSLMMVSQGRIAAHQGESMGVWFKRRIVSREEDVLLDGHSIHSIQPQRYQEVCEGVRSLPAHEKHYRVSLSAEEEAERAHQHQHHRNKDEASSGAGVEAEDEEDEDMTGVVGLEDEEDEHYGSHRADDVHHMLVIPFYGVDSRYGVRPYRSILPEVREMLLKEVGESGGEGAVEKRWRSISVVNGMGFDSADIIRRKIQMARDFGLTGVSFFNLYQDILPHIPQPPPKGKKGHASPPPPDAPPYALITEVSAALRDVRSHTPSCQLHPMDPGLLHPPAVFKHRLHFSGRRPARIPDENEIILTDEEESGMPVDIPYHLIDDL